MVPPDQMLGNTMPPDGMGMPFGAADGMPFGGPDPGQVPSPPPGGTSSIQRALAEQKKMLEAKAAGGCMGSPPVDPTAVSMGGWPYDTYDPGFMGGVVKGKAQAPLVGPPKARYGPPSDKGGPPMARPPGLQPPSLRPPGLQPPSMQPFGSQPSGPPAAHPRAPMPMQMTPSSSSTPKAEMWKSSNAGSSAPGKGALPYAKSAAGPWAPQPVLQTRLPSPRPLRHAADGPDRSFRAMSPGVGPSTVSSNRRASGTLDSDVLAGLEGSMKEVSPALAALMHGVPL